MSVKNEVLLRNHTYSYVNWILHSKRNKNIKSYMNEMTFADHVIKSFQKITIPKRLPKGVEVLFPFDQKEVQRCIAIFYKKYFDDQNQRIALLGINPGRLGSGITGIPFTDQYQLTNSCKIKNSFPPSRELSAEFIYDIIHAMDGPEVFYKRFFVSSVCPVGFLKDDINYNYYDGKNFKYFFESYIVASLKQTIAFGCSQRIAVCIGKGKNYKSLSLLNQKHAIFESIIPIPHPRWVMQYKRKQKTTILSEIIETLETL